MGHFVLLAAAVRMKGISGSNDIPEGKVCLPVYLQDEQQCNCIAFGMYEPHPEKAQSQDKMAQQASLLGAMFVKHGLPCTHRAKQGSKPHLGDSNLSCHKTFLRGWLHASCQPCSALDFVQFCTMNYPTSPQSVVLPTSSKKSISRSDFCTTRANNKHNTTDASSQHLVWSDVDVAHLPLQSTSQLRNYILYLIHLWTVVEFALGAAPAWHHTLKVLGGS